MPSGSEWIIVLVIVLLVFGGSQLPKLAKNLGKAQKRGKRGKHPLRGRTAPVVGPCAAKRERAQQRKLAAGRPCPAGN